MAKQQGKFAFVPFRPFTNIVINIFGEYLFLHNVSEKNNFGFIKDYFPQKIVSKRRRCEMSDRPHPTDKLFMHGKIQFCIFTAHQNANINY